MLLPFQVSRIFRERLIKTNREVHLQLVEKNYVIIYYHRDALLDCHYS